MSRYHSSFGIIINLRSIGEADLMVTLLTDDSGKIRLLAKGVKSLRSQRLRSLQLGNIVRAQYYKKNDFYWLNEITSLVQFLHERKSLTQLNLLFYFLEILNHFIADDQQIEGIYAISSNIIKAISDNQLTALVRHEIEFITLLGFGIPEEILSAYNISDLITCQKHIRQFLESIIEKPLTSSKLFS